jgi:hypothetical protein
VSGTIRERHAVTADLGVLALLPGSYRGERRVFDWRPWRFFRFACSVVKSVLAHGSFGSSTAPDLLLRAVDRSAVHGGLRYCGSKADQDCEYRQQHCQYGVGLGH